MRVVISYVLYWYTAHYFIVLNVSCYDRMGRNYGEVPDHGAFPDKNFVAYPNTIADKNVFLNNDMWPGLVRSRHFH